MEQRDIEALGPEYIDRFYVARAVQYFHLHIEEFDLGYFTDAEIESNIAIEQLRIRNERLNG